MDLGGIETDLQMGNIQELSSPYGPNLSLCCRGHKNFTVSIVWARGSQTVGPGSQGGLKPLKVELGGGGRIS